MKPSALDHNPFIASPEGWYWLGFFSADGNVRRSYKGGGSITLKIGEKDRAHLEEYRSFLGIKNKITETQGCVKLTFGSIEIAEWMIATGIKTQELDDGFLSDPDFLRGLMDGDGWIGDNSGPTPVLRFTLCCERELADRLAMMYGFRSYEHNGIGAVRGCGRKAQRWLEWLYQRPGPRLERKQKAMEKVLVKRNSVLRQNRENGS